MNRRSFLGWLGVGAVVGAVEPLRVVGALVPRAGPFAWASRSGWLEKPFDYGNRVGVAIGRVLPWHRWELGPGRGDAIRFERVKGLGGP